MEIFRFLNTQFFIYLFFILIRVCNNKMEMKVANILYTCRCEVNLYQIVLKLRRENIANTLLMKLLQEGKPVSLSNITGFIH